MIARFYGSQTTLEEFTEANGAMQQPWSANELLANAKHFNLVGRGIELDPSELKALQLPCILHWKFEHFVVLRQITFQGYCIDDPAIGRITVSYDELLDAFTGIALIFDPGACPYEHSESSRQPKDTNISSALGGIAPVQVMGALIGAALTICSPLIIKFILDEVVTKGDIAILRTAVLALVMTALMAAVVDWFQEHRLLQRTQAFHRECHRRILNRCFSNSDQSRHEPENDERERASLSEVPDLCHFYNREATLAVSSALIIFGYLALLSLIDGMSALILMGCCGAMALGSYSVRSDIRNAERLEHLEQQQFFGNLNDLFQHRQLIRQFSASFDCITGNDLRLKGLHHAMRKLKAQHWQSLLSAQAVNQLCQGILLYWVCSQIFAGTLTVGSFYLILTFRAQLVAHSLTVNHFIREALSRDQAAHRLMQVTKKNLNPSGRGDNFRATDTSDLSRVPLLLRSQPPNHGSLYFQRLEEHQSFLRVSAAMAQENRLAAGPSSLDNLKVAADRHIPVTIVPRYTPIFNGSITANITLFAPNPCWQHLQRVVELAGLSSGIRCHPLGLGSRIDAQHHRFDPMQQQQLGLARALFVRPQAVIIELHPATLKSAALQAALRRLLKENLSLVLLSRESIDPLPDLYTVARQGNTWQQVLEHFPRA